VPTETLARVGGSLATIATVTLPVETFTDEEQARLAPHFTNLDRPVFGLVNLPETVKGALFARYSRYPGTLRRLFLVHLDQPGLAHKVCTAVIAKLRSVART